MAKVVSIGKSVLLPFGETPLRAGQRGVVIQSAQARGRLRVIGIMIADGCRPFVRIQVHDREQRGLTSDQFVAAELVERLPLYEILNGGDQFEIVVEAIKDCLFVGALKCAQLWDV